MNGLSCIADFARTEQLRLPSPIQDIYVYLLKDVIIINSATHTRVIRGGALMGRRNVRPKTAILLLPRLALDLCRPPKLPSDSENRYGCRPGSTRPIEDVPRCQ